MKTLHVQCGDCSAATLAATGIAGDILVWHEIYIEGPAPGGLSHDDWVALRSQYLTRFGLTLEEAQHGMQDMYARFDAGADRDEVVLWFDACMFDQTILAHLLARLGDGGRDLNGLSLICIGKRGLGELNVDETAALYPTRAPVTREQIRLGQAAWAAFTASDPRRIEAFVRDGSAALPFLAPALLRHLEQFPSTRNGLSRLEHAALDVVAGGAHKLGAIFKGVSAREEEAFLGDISLWAYLDQLAQARHPLLSIDGPGSIVRPLKDPLQDIGRWDVALTGAGRDVLNGAADAVRLNGIDRWLGGVHLQGDEAAWRWDSVRRSLVSRAPL